MYGCPVHQPCDQRTYLLVCIAKYLIQGRQWNDNDPDDKTQWACQHDTLCRYGPGPPYVYNVRQGDRPAFRAAIQSALEHPIDRYILNMTRQSAVAERLDAILHRDLYGMASELLRQREAGIQQGEVSPHSLWSRERCCSHSCQLFDL